MDDGRRTKRGRGLGAASMMVKIRRRCNQFDIETVRGVAYRVWRGEG